MNYSFDDENINELRVGDTLTLEDGTKHIAIKDEIYNPPCVGNCSIIEVRTRLLSRCKAFTVSCSVHNFHFNEV